MDDDERDDMSPKIGVALLGLRVAHKVEAPSPTNVKMRLVQCPEWLRRRQGAEEWNVQTGKVYLRIGDRMSANLTYSDNTQ